MDGQENLYSVGLLHQYAVKLGEDFFEPALQVDECLDLGRGQIDQERVGRANADFPILVVVEESGHLSVADGVHRLIKSRLAGKRTIGCFCIPWTDEAFKRTVLLDHFARFPHNN